MSINKNRFMLLAAISIIAIFSAFFIFRQIARAEEINPDAVVKFRQQKEEELKNLESQIETLSSNIEDFERQATTLQRDIAIYDAQIAKAKLEIKARDLSIADLADDIQQHTKLISALSMKLDDQKNSLAELLRRQNELDSTSLIEIVLGYGKLSDFFTEVSNSESIQKAIQTSFEEIGKTKTNTEEEKATLEEQKSEEMELRNLQVLEKQREEQAKADKNNLLKATNGKEKEYQKILTQRQKDAATIRSQLFILAGSPAIPFEKALEYASAVSKITGIRIAYLLGVIAEESNLGANIGTGNWKIELADSHCTNQRDAFSSLTASLGFDPDLMPVSKRAWYGYCGGAMGPAQFMPTTWQLYTDRIAKITGHNPPNPWDAFDAFAAAALLLKDNGAVGGNYTSERNAALKYLAGSKWKKSAYAFYGDDVMALAAKYQEQINILQGS